MDAKTSLSSIEFTMLEGYIQLIASVKVNYTDGSYKVFKNEVGSFVDHDAYTFDHINQPIRAISSAVEGYNYSNKISFLGPNQEEIYEYNPRNQYTYVSTQTHEIKINEQIIGVYGFTGIPGVGLERFGLIL